MLQAFVAFNFAIAAVLTGSFSPGDAVVKFFLMAFGGSSVASWWCGSPANATTFSCERTREGAGNSDPDKPAYPLRCLFAGRGVPCLRHSCCGGRRHCAMHYEQLSGPRLPATRMKSSAVWTMLETTLNGMIFLHAGRAAAAHAENASCGGQSGRRLVSRYLLLCTRWPSPWRLA